MTTTLRFFRVSALLALMLSAAIPSAIAAGVVVQVSPTSASVPILGTRQFAVSVSGTANTAVTWTVNDLVGGNAVFGTINSAGLFTGPAVPPPGWTVTVKAVSVADPTATGPAVVTVRNQIPWVTTLSPSTIGLGPFTLLVNGSRFVNGAQVLWNGAPLPTTFVSAVQLKATGSALQKGTVPITVANPGPGAVSTALYLTVTSSVAVTVTPSSTSITPGATLQYQASVTGTANTAVVWKVNGVTGGDPGLGTVSANGLYTAPLVIPIAGTVAIAAQSVADGVTQGTATLFFQDPLAVTYGRFLDQTTFGPTPQLIAYVKKNGMSAFLDEQFATPESPWPAVASATRSNLIDAFFNNAVNGQDQLRQRVVFALSEIIVISMNKNTNGEDLVPWLQILSRNAFGNYRTLLREITIDASMGKYLDLANSSGGSGMGGTGANENYPREVMQLFTSEHKQLDATGN